MATGDTGRTVDDGAILTIGYAVVRTSISAEIEAFIQLGKYPRQKG